MADTARWEYTKLTVDPSPTDWAQQIDALGDQRWEGPDVREDPIDALFDRP